MPETDEVVVTPKTLREWPLPAPADDKEARGRALVVGGSVANPGAVLLAGQAALRVGAGKIQLVTAAEAATAMAVAFPEAMVKGSPTTRDGDLDDRAAVIARELAQGCKATLVGPGILDVDDATMLMEELVPDWSGGVLLIDALALAWVTADHARLHPLEGNVILSPNVAELALTLGEDEDRVERDIAGAVARLARSARAVVTSGKESTWTATPDGRLWRVDTGGPGLAVAGSGDVKAGTILGLCARGVGAAQATVWGSYLHGATGDRLASRVGPMGYLARELSAEVPALLMELED